MIVDEQAWVGQQREWVAVVAAVGDDRRNFDLVKGGSP
jgi:hypothetical protein